jgi:hypothetical protein
MAVTTLRQVRQMPHSEVEDFFFYYATILSKKKYNINLYSDRNDIH